MLNDLFLKDSILQHIQIGFKKKISCVRLKDLKESYQNVSSPIQTLYSVTWVKIKGITFKTS